MHVLPILVLSLRSKLYYHGPVGTTEFVLYREVKCIASFKRGSTALCRLLWSMQLGLKQIVYFDIRIF